jgi:hypothetical protein
MTTDELLYREVTIRIMLGKQHDPEWLRREIQYGLLDREGPYYAAYIASHVEGHRDLTEAEAETALRDYGG